MDRKWLIPIIILLIVFLALVVAYIGDNHDASAGETRSFNVSAGYSNLSRVIVNIKTLPYYEGYNATTVEWMESLGDKQVVYGDNELIIVSDADAEKINQAPDVTDVYIYNHFTAKVVEKHELNRNFTVYYLEDIHYDGYEIIGNGLA